MQIVPLKVNLKIALLSLAVMITVTYGDNKLLQILYKYSSYITLVGKFLTSYLNNFVITFKFHYFFFM